MYQIKKPFAKKWIVSVIVFLVLAGCANNSQPREQPAAAKVATSEPAKEPPNPVESPKQSEQPKHAEEQPKNDLPMLTQSGGLGDTLTAIEKNYGKNENNPDTSLSAYNKGRILVMYTESEKIAHNVTLQFEATEKPRRTKDEAMAEVQKSIPTDAIKVKEYKVDENRDIIQYESKALADRLVEYYAAVDESYKSLGISSKPVKHGTFIVILKHDNRGFFASVIGLGDKP
ncbi:MULTISPECIES: hypothetical protein [unclassified Paenibacillus]|uniref:hypothetical protein n=1 Tax=unclassified Paenibacillus TaxID=185978 RepID=UPI002782C47D|nr:MULTISPECIES: hypothetical protein [unclassified Paenibacillus]MDQ0896296.1 hypothetical protein [Paenibacillus sp. V4I7]MDQ0913776.1 hypothetical protein [Paenibacillus sp. V4I5]